ncbi:hypothetical protein [Sphingomonas sp.]|uniref:hypothetical protein n=1 Tax=Sphingomonas sp. TaxID=28214 RepID=UPI002ED9BE05
MADEKVTVVDATGDRGGGSAVAMIVGIVAILAILYVLFGTNLLSGETKKIDADVKIETPSK